jgi:hypothetical protein
MDDKAMIVRFAKWIPGGLRNGTRVNKNIPQGLKPGDSKWLIGTTKVVPFQSIDWIKDSLT